MYEPLLALDKLTHRADLSSDEARALFELIMSGAIDQPTLTAILHAWAAKGECVDELVGAATAMRAHVTPVRLPATNCAIDTCGTGGDGKPTFNVSSAVAIVAAAAGAVVAKHGNRSATRPSGSAEGLAALGINIDADVPLLERCLRECRVAFLFAPHLHPAMRHAAAVRKAVGVRTIFNLVGPLTNPAGVTRQFMGVSRAEHVELMLRSLQELGAQRAMIVHGLEGLCDLSISGPSRIGRWDGKAALFEEVDCSVVGLRESPLESIFVDCPTASARKIEEILDGVAGAARDVVIFNSAAAIWVSGLVNDWPEGGRVAREAIDSGAAMRVLSEWRRISNGG